MKGKNYSPPFGLLLVHFFQAQVVINEFSAFFSDVADNYGDF